MSYVDHQLLTDDRLEKISPGIGKLLSDHSKAVIIMRETEEEISKEFSDHIQKYEDDLKKNYRIRARVSDWLHECIAREEVMHIFLDQGHKI